jgi:hypothetical protein
VIAHAHDYDHEYEYEYEDEDGYEYVVRRFPATKAIALRTQAG